MRLYTWTANVRCAKMQPSFIRSRVEMFAGEKANTWPLTNQMEVGAWLMSHNKKKEKKYCACALPENVFRQRKAN